MPEGGDGGRRIPPVLGTYLTLGLQLALSVVVFLLIGLWADQQWAIGPWGTIGGLIVGATGGFIKFIRTAMALGKQADEEARVAKGRKS